MLLRADSAFFTHDVVAAARRADARFSITARLNPAVTAAISSLDQDGWTPIQDPNALWDAEEHRWISDAEVAEVPFTAFTSRRKAEHLTARLLVRRVKRLNPRSTSGSSTEQGELFAAYRYHAVFTDSPLALIDADQTHRAHAIIEQVIADLKNGPLAHLPSGEFNANAAWLVLAAIAFNLTRAAGCLASRLHAQGHHRHPARSTHQRSRTAGALSPTPRAAPAPALALAGRPAAAAHGHDWTTTPSSLTARLPGPTGTPRGTAGQTGNSHALSTSQNIRHR